MLFESKCSRRWTCDAQRRRRNHAAQYGERRGASKAPHESCTAPRSHRSRDASTRAGPAYTPSANAGFSPRRREAECLRNPMQMYHLGRDVRASAALNASSAQAARDQKGGAHPSAAARRGGRARALA
eukprot:6200901-Pleurochrysis_carterae.AAC.3